MIAPYSLIFMADNPVSELPFAPIPVTILRDLNPAGRVYMSVALLAVKPDTPMWI